MDEKNEGQEANVEEASSETPSPAAPSPGPWAQDLEASFQDEAVRGQVDEFLRKNVQPHVTKLEQDSAPNRDASRLWDDFRQNPVETYLAVTSELFGEDVGGDITKVLQEIDENPPENPVTDGETAPVLSAEGQERFANLPPEAQEAIEYVQNQRRENAYEEEFERVSTDEDGQDVVFNKDIFHPFVVAAEGDFDAAATAYKEWYTQAKAEFGAEIPESLPEGDEAPATLDSSAASQTPPPTAKKYDSIDEALDDFFAEQHSPPPTV